jgi:hypothetical protein
MEQRACEYCGRPLPSDARRNQRFCGKTHKRQARRQAKHREELHASLVARSPHFADASLTEPHARPGKPDWRDDPRNFSDFGEIPGDLLAAELDAEDENGIHYGNVEPEPEWVQQDKRFHSMLQDDAARRTPRRTPRAPWFDLKRFYNRNPGVEKADITQERADRYKSEQAAIQARLRNSKGQPQDRFNDVTKDVVAIRSARSRRLNRVFATADPRPMSQRQEFSFEAEQTTWDAYRGGRAPGQRGRYSDYAWNMGDGFRF